MLSKSLFGPLDKKYCDYFYFFSVAGFIVMIMSILFILVFIVRFYKILNSHIMINLIMIVVNSFLLYFSNRLLYTMCMKTL